MLWYIFAVIVPIFLVLLQTVFQPIILINGTYPELAMIGILYYANSRGQLCGQFIGLTAGLSMDFLSEAPLGFFACIGTLIGFLAGTMKKNMYSESILAPVLLTFLALLVKEVSVFILAGIFQQITLYSNVFGPNYVFHNVYTLVLAPIIFSIFRFLDSIIAKKRRSNN